MSKPVKGTIVKFTPALTVRRAQVDRQGNRLFDRVERSFHLLTGLPPQRVKRRSPLGQLLPRVGWLLPAIERMSALVPARGKQAVYGLYTSSRPEPMPKPGEESTDPTDEVKSAWSTHIRNRRALGSRKGQEGIDSLLRVNRVALAVTFVILVGVLLSFGPDFIAQVTSMWGS